MIDRELERRKTRCVLKYRAEAVEMLDKLFGNNMQLRYREHRCAVIASDYIGGCESANYIKMHIGWSAIHVAACLSNYDETYRLHCLNNPQPVLSI